jgi:hypothetical protein
MGLILSNHKLFNFYDMTKSILRFMLLWLLMPIVHAFAGPTEPTKDKEPIKPANNTLVLPAGMSKARALQLQQALHKAMDGLNTGFASAEYTEVQQPLVALETNAARDSAAAVFNKVKYIKELNVLNQELPIGVKETIGNTTVEVAISKFILRPNYGEITIYCRLHIKDKNAPNGERDVFFGARGIKIANGGIIGDAQLVLLGDVAIPFADNSFTLKGGFDENTGASNGLTYVTVDCKGFREVSINGEFKFSRSVVMPYDEEKREPKSGNVIVPIRTIATSLDDIFVTVDVPSFCVNGLNNWGYAIRNATFDFSDERHPSGAVFPKINNVPYMQAVGEPDPLLWRGVYVRSFEVLFPKEFLLKGGQKISAKAQNLIIDKHGVSTLVNISVAAGSPPPSTVANGRAGKWKMSVTDLFLELVTNKVEKGGLGGELILPISNTGAASNSSAGDKLLYTGIISKTGRVDFTVANASVVKFGMFGVANAKLLPGSTITLSTINGRIRPRAVLTGSINIKNIASDDGGGSNTTELNGLVFRELILQDSVPKITAKYFGYVKPSNSGSFPISLDQLSVTLVNPNTPSATVGCGTLSPSTTRTYGIINIQSSVSLDSSFGGSAGFSIAGFLDNDPVEEADYVEFQCMKLNSLCVKANFSAFAINAGFKIINNGTQQGFEGQIQLTIKKPELQICATGRFTKTNGRSNWYIDGGAVFNPGISIGAVEINSIGGALYRRMAPIKDAEVPVNNPAACVSCNMAGNTGAGYEIANDVALGFRAVVGLKGGGKSFTGQAGFEMRFTEHWGLLSVGLFGRGELAPKNTLPPAFSELKEKFNKFAGTVSSTETAANANKLLSKTELDSNIGKMFTSIPSLGVENKIAFDFSLLLDLSGEKNILHGEANLYANVGGGTLVGRGPQARAGWVAMHFEQGLWYIHAGSPTDKLGLRLNLALIRAEVGGYFMVGHRIPSVGPLPAQMVALLSASEKATVETERQNSRSADVGTGNGIAFGADLSLSTGDVTFLIFYANLSAGVGFDVMMKQSSVCNTANGGNGWYAYGRMYAYMMGEIGATFKIPFKRVRLPVFQGGAGILLEGGLPNPAWFAGTMAGRYRLLNGLIKGDFKMDVNIGKTQCTL